MKRTRKDSERIVLISSERIELFNPESGQWEKLTELPYFPLIVNTNTSKFENGVINEITFTSPYSNEPVPSYETETYIINSERELSYVRNLNENYNDTDYRIRYNNEGVKTIEEMIEREKRFRKITSTTEMDEYEYIMDRVRRVKRRMYDLAKRLYGAETDVETHATQKKHK